VYLDVTVHLSALQCHILCELPLSVFLCLLGVFAREIFHCLVVCSYSLWFAAFEWLNDSCLICWSKGAFFVYKWDASIWFMTSSVWFRDALDILENHQMCVRNSNVFEFHEEGPPPSKIKCQFAYVSHWTWLVNMNLSLCQLLMFQIFSKEGQHKGVLNKPLVKQKCENVSPQFVYNKTYMLFMVR